MALHPGQRLLLAPVDMPRLELESLRALVAAAEAGFDPDTIHLAHDGRRLQPCWVSIRPLPPTERRRTPSPAGAGAACCVGSSRPAASVPWSSIQPSCSMPTRLGITGQGQATVSAGLRQAEPPAAGRPGRADVAAPTPPLDQLGRPPGVLRLSLTARCNLACPYCCPDSQDPPELLSHTERLQLVSAAAELGFSRLRLTGGEPLLHRGLEELVAALRPLRGHRDGSGSMGLSEIALTTNGVLLSSERARELWAAGLDRITVSLDGTDGASVARMAGLAGGARAGEALLEKVLRALDHACDAGFDPARGALKLNAVIARGRNEDQLLSLAELARQRGIELRLIEFMDVGNRNGWQPDLVLPAAEMVRRIGAHWPLEPLGRQAHGTASRWRYRDGGGISPWWPRSRPPSAATATDCASPPTGWPTPACSPPVAWTSSPGCARLPPLGRP